MEEGVSAKEYLSGMSHSLSAENSKYNSDVDEKNTMPEDFEENLGRNLEDFETPKKATKRTYRKKEKVNINSESNTPPVREPSPSRSEPKPKKSSIKKDEDPQSKKKSEIIETIMAYQNSKIFAEDFANCTRATRKHLENQSLEYCQEIIDEYENIITHDIKRTLVSEFFDMALEGGEIVAVNWFKVKELTGLSNEVRKEPALFKRDLEQICCKMNNGLIPNPYFRIAFNVGRVATKMYKARKMTGEHQFQQKGSPMLPNPQAQQEAMNFFKNMKNHMDKQQSLFNKMQQDKMQKVDSKAEVINISSESDDEDINEQHPKTF